MIEPIFLKWILAAPLLSASLIALAHLYLMRRDYPQDLVTFLGLAGPGVSAFFGIILALGNYADGSVVEATMFNWLAVDTFTVDVTLRTDPLSSAMLLFVAPVGFLIHVYAVGYMRGDPGYARFFALFNLFMFFMLLLILSDSPIMLFVGWEGVGLCSYALIAFYFQDGANVEAGNKAFILNRIGDFGFLSALMLLFLSIGEQGFTFSDIFMHIETIHPDRLTLIGALLFVGAAGKSAQIPLYVWLPDAMAGPTPVSALIHAATMVTAGVYMMARFHPLYLQVPDVGLVIAYIGAFSALLAALIATRQNDIKKILAYSTMSQLGYMFMAAGLGAYSLAIFHVFAHAFFKALLFMGAGAVIIAMHHEQDITKMGGLRKRLPATFKMMLIGTLALTAIPPFAGFISKDAIMAHLSHEPTIYLMALMTAALTAYYMFRLMFFVFWGKVQRAVHQVPRIMLYPMAVLTFFSVVIGVFNLPALLGGDESFSRWLGFNELRTHLPHDIEWLLMGINLVLIIVAVRHAYMLFGGEERLTLHTSDFFARWIERKFYVDELYGWLFVRPLRALSAAADLWLNLRLIDTLVNQSALRYYAVAKEIKRLQNGSVRYYALYIGIVMSMIAVYLHIHLGV